MSWYRWKPYVPVAARRAKALKKMASLRKKGIGIQPVEITGRKIARTFWGEAWCDHLETFSDYDNRLPRGRTYVRNGSVCHLDIARGEVNAMVSGSELYKVKIAVKTLPRARWIDVKGRCAGQIGSLLELLQGRFSKNVMTVVTDHKAGLFPSLEQISLGCNCPDWAVMCKHVAAVLYGVGARFDEKPELLFLLRGVDHKELISAEVGVATVAGKTKGGRKRIADDALADVFGIEMSGQTPSPKERPARRRKTSTAKPVRMTPGAAAKRKATRKAKAGTGIARARKNPAPQKADTNKTPRPTGNRRPVTGKAVAKLREKFGMSQSQFAKILGVSAPSISNWEKKTGTLNLQPRTRDAWHAVKGLTKQQAWRKAKRS